MAKAPIQKAHLAAEIFRAAQQESDPAAKHAEFRKAAELVVAAGDGALGLEISRAFAAAFKSADKRTPEELLADADRRWDEAQKGPKKDQLTRQLAAAELWFLARGGSKLLGEKWEGRFAEIEATSRRLVFIDRKAAKDDVAMLMGKWEVNWPGRWKTIWVFSSDGTVLCELNSLTGRWLVEPTRIKVNWRDGSWHSFPRPLTTASFAGDSSTQVGILTIQRIR